MVKKEESLLIWDRPQIKHIQIRQAVIVLLNLIKGAREFSLNKWLRAKI